MLAKAVSHLTRPFQRLLLRTLPLQDPWARFPLDVPLRYYGLGARRTFEWYFEGESTVPVDTVEAIQQWLLGCTYACDPDLFNEADFWQHPRTFEQMRRGDCEDFALWTWRKLVQLGFDAEFVAGRCPTWDGPPKGHAWVHLREQGVTTLFDPILRYPAAMLRPLSEVQDAYLPEVSVDGNLNRYIYAAYFG